MKMDCGLHHIGLEVDDLEEIKGRFLALNPRGVILQEPDDVHHGEIRIHDPECLPVSLSTKGFGVPASKEKRFRGSPHRLQRPDPEMMLRFHQVFGCECSRPVLCAGNKPRQPLLRRRQDQSGDYPFYNRIEGQRKGFLRYRGGELGVLKIAPRTVVPALRGSPLPRS